MCVMLRAVIDKLALETTKRSGRCSHLSPVFEEVLPEHVLGGVLVIEHLGEESGHLFGRRVQFHLLALRKTPR